MGKLLTLAFAVIVMAVATTRRADAACTVQQADPECLFYASYYGWDPSVCYYTVDSVTGQGCQPVCGNLACDLNEEATCPSDCGTTNRIIYLHGRDFNTWPVNGFITNNPAWTNIRLNYNGSGRLHDQYTRNLIRDALINNCGTHTANQCIIITASAGAPRTLLGLHDVAALGYSLRIPWQGHYASAEGGTEIADKWTRGWRRVVGRLMGKRRNGDDDLRTGRLRNDYWYIHYTPSQPVYMQAGERNQTLYQKESSVPVTSIVKAFRNGGGTPLTWLSIAWSLVSFKISGNGHFPCRKGDGMVPVHSAGGYAQIACYYSMCDSAAKYPWRTQHTCNLLPTSHMDTIVHSLMYGAAPQLAATKSFSSCSPDPEDIAGVEEAVTTDDSADVAGVPQENSCARFYCLVNGEAVCDASEPDDRTVTACANFDCYFGGTPPTCGDYVCEAGEESTCPNDCNYYPYPPYWY